MWTPRGTPGVGSAWGDSLTSSAMGGQIVDATVVEARRPWLTQDEKRTLRARGTPEGWSKARTRQIDRGGRWTIKRGRTPPPAEGAGQKSGGRRTASPEGGTPRAGGSRSGRDRHRRSGGLDHPLRRWRGEQGLDLGQQERAVGLERQRGVAAARPDGLGDGDLGADGVDGDQRAGQFAPFQQDRNGGDLVRRVVHRLLAEHQALPAGPGREQMQRLAALAPRMGAPCRLAVERDHRPLLRIGRCRLPQPGDPGGEAVPEQPRIESGDHLAQLWLGIPCW